MTDAKNDKPIHYNGLMELTAEMKYRLLLEIGQSVRDTLDLDIILDHILDIVQTILPYDAAGIFVLNRDLASLEYGPARHVIAGVARRGFDAKQPESDPMLTEGKGIIGYVIQTGERLVVEDVQQNPHYIVGREETKSEIAVPIVMNQRVIGALNIESDQPAAFDGRDLDMLQFFADAAAISIEKAILHRQIVEKELLEKQLQTASEVQQRLLPKGSPGISGYDIAGICIPTEDVGGDYFDYIQLPYQQVGVGVADVSGHGIPSALVMTAFRALLRTHAHSRSQPTRIAETINRQLPEFTGDQHFVTAFYAVLEPEDGSLKYVSCGHPSPILLRADGKAEYLDKRGPALGIFPKADYPPGMAVLAPGDLLAIYTDGVTEVEDLLGNWFGLERLVQVLRQNRELPMKSLARVIVDETRKISGTDQYRDDFTLVLVKRN